jgi:hypothetical protein
MKSPKPIVSKPVSEYIRWEHEITSANVETGEDVQWLPRRRASDLLLRGNDFWVFDDRMVLWTHFTGEGEILPEGWEVTEDRPRPRYAQRRSGRCGTGWCRTGTTGLPDHAPV